MNSQLAACYWLNSTLTGDADMQVYVSQRWFLDRAPEVDAATRRAPLYPLGLLSQQAPRDLLGPGGALVQAQPLMLVRVLTREQGLGQVAAAVAQLDATLKAAALGSFSTGVESWTFAGLVQESPWADSWTEDGVEYHAAGGLYRLYLNP